MKLKFTSIDYFGAVAAAALPTELFRAKSWQVFRTNSISSVTEVGTDTDCIASTTIDRTDYLTYLQPCVSIVLSMLSG